MEIAKLFSNSSALYLLNREGVSPVDRSQDIDPAAGLYMIASDLCLFSCLDLFEVPTSLRSNFIGQRALQLSPFKATGYYAQLVDNKAQLWIWDKQLESKAPDGPEVRFIPEQLLLLVPSTNLCVRLDSQRYQLEYWQGGLLQAVKFYLHRSEDDHDQVNFIAANSIAEQDAVWSEASFGYLDFPRDEPAPLSKQWLIQPKVLTATALALSAILLAGFFGNYLGWSYLVDSKRTEVNSGSADIQPLLKLREQTLQLERKNQLISQFFEHAPVIELVAEFEQSVGAFYDELLEWNFDDGSLTVLLLDQSANSRKYIEALSASELFEQVSASPGVRPDSVLVQIKVIPGAGRSIELSPKVSPEDRQNTSEGAS